MQKVNVQLDLSVRKICRTYRKQNIPGDEKAVIKFQEGVGGGKDFQGVRGCSL